ncbi:hypothetical protein LEMA_P021220.1 [Plenodomus lingam JN3]|uniref:G-protein coupled receptors family 1 profile domain-containing protein n=1 Tax=Leptosphaeria maculans (strain JN3 / isolate v23.1.3 / race Av1-4-5-6-7-8) TaxID=985895 RepID=E5ABF1_LEPMJ|nr:hypothetical protein LEMA_P021220.1 [Plenodomus lingam JN3]CBY00992.1 hypothetical protein LEMA_P021220.1 [Plenodomus lingam JN3]
MAPLLWLLGYLVLTTLTITSAAPTSNTTALAHHAEDLQAQDSVNHGETSTSRTAFTALCLSSVSTLTCLAGNMSDKLHCLLPLTGQGNRVQSMGIQQLKSPNFSQVLVLLLFAFSTSFVVSAAIVTIGLDLATASTCRIAVHFCLAFYVGSKVIIYVFLVERAHAIRAPFRQRHFDKLWLFSMLAIGLGFGSTAITGFIWPIAELGRDNQRCHIGLKRRVTIVLLVVDVWLNVFLTLIFVYLISPSVRSMDISFLSFPASRFTMCLGNMCHRSKNKVDVDLHRSNPRVVHQMEHLLVKTLVGSIFIMVPTTANLTALCIFEGRELGWVCLTICVLDVTWQTCVFHWLTEGISEARQKASAGSVRKPKPHSVPLN